MQRYLRVWLLYAAENHGSICGWQMESYSPFTESSSQSVQVSVCVGGGVGKTGIKP